MIFLWSSHDFPMVFLGFSGTRVRAYTFCVRASYEILWTGCHFAEPPFGNVSEWSACTTNQYIVRLRCWTPPLINAIVCINARQGVFKRFLGRFVTKWLAFGEMYQPDMATIRRKVIVGQAAKGINQEMPSINRVMLWVYRKCCQLAENV